MGHHVGKAHIPVDYPGELVLLMEAPDFFHLTLNPPRPPIPAGGGRVPPSVEFYSASGVRAWVEPTVTTKVVLGA